MAAGETGPPTISVEEVMREFFIDMKKELNTKCVSDVLYVKRMIYFDLKKNIDREANQADANELLLEHLIRNGTLDTLRRFCEVLKETAESHSLPHHRAWSNKLKQKLTKVSRHKLNRIIVRILLLLHGFLTRTIDTLNYVRLCSLECLCSCTPLCTFTTQLLNHPHRHTHKHYLHATYDLYVSCL